MLVEVDRHIFYTIVHGGLKCVMFQVLMGISYCSVLSILTHFLLEIDKKKMRQSR